MSLDDLQRDAANVPFEPAFHGISLLATKLWPIWTDGEKQIELAREVWGDVPLIELFERFVEQYPAGVPFSPQQLAITQRLLIDHAREAPLSAEIAQDEILSLTRVVVYAHDLAAAHHRPIEEGRASRMELLAYLMQTGAYYERPALLNTFARTNDLFLERARVDTEPLVPLDQWSEGDYRTTLEEQLAGGFGYAASANAFVEDSAVVLLQPPILRDTALAERETDIAATLSAGRAWFQAEFAKGDQTVRDIAWEVTPFLRRPYLRLSDDQLIVISPTAVNEWLGQGFYDRLRESAKARKTKRRDTLSDFGSYYGTLVEAYALDFVRSVIHEGVHGDIPYGRGGGSRTPDIAIARNEDIALIEVRSRSPEVRGSERRAMFPNSKSRSPGW